jgi:hypothetical protein
LDAAKSRSASDRNDRDYVILRVQHVDRDASARRPPGHTHAGLCFGEGARQATSILGRPASSSRRLEYEGLEADDIENGDEPPEQLGHRIDFLTQPRKQGALDMIPARPHGVERIGQPVNRVFESYTDIVDACCAAWNALTEEPKRIASIATRDWASVIA